MRQWYSNAVSYIGAPAREVAGNPLLPARPADPILSIQVRQFYAFPPTINPV
jgi:hypothetical protein